jgi:FkbM family methyltransferase
MTKVSPTLVRRLINFRKKSALERFESYWYRWHRWFPGLPAPVRLPNGVWWLMDDDFIGESLLKGSYESAEADFMESFVKPGITVVDIGAHRGFHTLRLSKKVGSKGRVVAIEPSGRDVARLKLHLKINFCRNVEVMECALGEQEGSADLYTVPANSVLNSLRPPDTELPSSRAEVRVRRLDDVLSGMRIGGVDFIKMDVEGGELAVLKGAEHLLERVARPVILCEILEQRTRPWGYAARQIADHLLAKNFRWFELTPEGRLNTVADYTQLCGNFVAVPEESLLLVRDLQTAVDIVPGVLPEAGFSAAKR